MFYVRRCPLCDACFPLWIFRLRSMYGMESWTDRWISCLISTRINDRVSHRLSVREGGTGIHLPGWHARASYGSARLEEELFSLRRPAIAQAPVIRRKRARYPRCCRALRCQCRPRWPRWPRVRPPLRHLMTKRSKKPPTPRAHAIVAVMDPVTQS